jgi:hypothetical protein
VAVVSDDRPAASASGGVGRGGCCVEPDCEDGLGCRDGLHGRRHWCVATGSHGDQSSRAAPGPSPASAACVALCFLVVSYAGCNVFKGIPYAQSPLGSLRWQAPMPVMPWSNVRNATVSAAACLQAPGENVGRIDEDCL